MVRISCSKGLNFGDNDSRLLGEEDGVGGGVLVSRLEGEDTDIRDEEKVEEKRGEERLN